jgi:hypothetical protein
MTTDQIEALAASIDILLRNYVDLSNRMIAMEVVCAKLVQELASAGGDQEGVMLRVTSELRGIADVIARGNQRLERTEDYDASVLTRALERLCSMAEGGFSSQ